MPNLLHTFLRQGFVQAIPYLGEEFTLLGAGYTGFFSPADDRLLMEIVGYLDEADLICVVSLDQFEALATPAPQVKDQILREDGIYSVRGVKTDQSSYTLVLKRISETLPVPVTSDFGGNTFGGSALGTTTFG